MLKFTFFIDTRGLEYCLEIHGTLLGSPSTHSFLQERWRCIRSKLGCYLAEPKSVAKLSPSPSTAGLSQP